MDFTEEEKEHCVLYVHADGALSLGASVEVQDLGDELVLHRAGQAAKLYAGPDAKVGNVETGQVYAQVPLLRKLAGMPRGQQLPMQEWDSVEGALIAEAA